VFHVYEVAVPLASRAANSKGFEAIGCGIGLAFAVELGLAIGLAAAGAVAVGVWAGVNGDAAGPAWA
jgi:hypothetical protein